MLIPYFHVDAFTERIFGGNPAGVCLLDGWLPNDRLQKLAAQHNLSETAFLVETAPGHYDLRWFTPKVEVDLCGHATLSAAHVLWRHLAEAEPELVFETLSGPLTVQRRDDMLVMDFPARPAKAMSMPDDAAEILSAAPVWSGRANYNLFLFEDEETVRGLTPDFVRLKKWGRAMVTAPGRDCDFVSRYFAPGAGIDEDPVTGSAHCTLAPFWGERLGKTVLHARQVSARGGEVFCELAGDRVKIAGRAVTYLQGTITC